MERGREGLNGQEDGGKGTVEGRTDRGMAGRKGQTEVRRQGWTEGWTGGGEG